jgi:hypothetical protein
MHSVNMKTKVLYIQLLGDALIPLFGFFVWNWSLYFILLYYILDLFLNELLAHLKARKVYISNGSGLKKSWLGYGTFSFSLFVAVVFLIHVAVYFLHREINFSSEAQAFWNYEELGIKQGYVLLPLLAFVAFQRYKMEFLYTGLFQRVKMRELWLKHLQQFPVLFAACGLAIGVNYFVQVDDMIYLVAIVILNGFYRYFVSRRPV